MSYFTDNNVQNRAMMKEQAKIDRIIRDNEARRQRFLINPKQRLIGVDLQALDSQAEEARLRKEHEKELILQERLRLEEMERFLNQNEKEEQQIKTSQMNQLKSAWNQHTKQKELQQLQYKQSKLNVINTSLSGAQPLAGEDDEKSSRLKAQKEQLKVWLAEQLEDKNKQREHTRQYEERYDQMVRLLTEIREQDELAELEFRRKLNIDVTNENHEVCSLYITVYLTHIMYTYTIQYCLSYVNAIHISRIHVYTPRLVELVAKHRPIVPRTTPPTKKN